jgi:Flp pilus assembly protein TadG
MKVKPTQLSRQRGNAVVELALVIFVLLMLLAGMVEVGRGFAYYEALTKATRDGARAMSVADKATIASSAVATAKALVNQAAQDSNVPNFSTSLVTVTCLKANYVADTCTDGTAPVGVTVAINNYDLLVGGWMPFLIGPASRHWNFAPSTTMRYMK